MNTVGVNLQFQTKEVWENIRTLFTMSWIIWLSISWYISKNGTYLYVNTLAREEEYGLLNEVGTSMGPEHFSPGIQNTYIKCKPKTVFCRCHLELYTLENNSSAIDTKTLIQRRNRIPTLLWVRFFFILWLFYT